jgi:hypothetical protein
MSLSYTNTEVLLGGTTYVLTFLPLAREAKHED